LKKKKPTFYFILKQLTTYLFPVGLILKIVALWVTVT